MKTVSDLELRYKKEYKSLPMDDVDNLLKIGFNRSQAFTLIQSRMDLIWQNAKEEKQRELEKQCPF